MLATRIRPTSRQQQREQWLSFAAVYGALCALFLLVVGLVQVHAPPYGAAMLILLVSIGACVLRPQLGLGAAISLAIIGDSVAMPWWPATKNLSSRESILYTADLATIKPIEILLIVVVATIVANRHLSSAARPLVLGPLWRPMAVFSCSLVLGMAWGLANGGDARIAIFEVAPLLYVPLVYFAACNLYPSVRSYQWLMAGIVAGLTAEVINGLVRLPTIRQLIAADQSPLEHTALLHLNLLPLLLLACLWFGTDRIGLRLLLSVLLVPAMLLYLDAQRRAAVVALIVGTIALSAVLFVRNRTRFNVFVPVLVVLLTGYVGAFWSSDNQIGFPAQAIRSVIAPSSASEADSLSDLYRYIENFDLNATIRSNPLLGLGFGRPFLQPIELPDIVSFFEFADYQPHNTILWIWIKTGLVGFIAFMYMIGVALAQGMRAAVRVVASDEASVVAVLSSYLPMAVVVAFVEISGEAATTMLLGLALAMASTVGERLEPV